MTDRFYIEPDGDMNPPATSWRVVSERAWLDRQRIGSSARPKYFAIAFDQAGAARIAQALNDAAEVERLQKVLADQALTIGCLRDDNARLQLGVEAAKIEDDDHRRTRAQLKRFTDREPLIDAIKQATIEELPKAVCDLEVWEQENPKP